MDVELVYLDGVWRIHAFTHRERNLIAPDDDDLRAVTRTVVLEVVVADGCAARLGPRNAGQSNDRDGYGTTEQTLHAPNTISPARSPAATSASIPNVAKLTSPTARRPISSSGVLFRRHR